ncbi:mitochondrial import inner membrane translocase subunit Tim21 isoform X2 [Condylostylus longicornis]|uniref:mitochondrial import inner membrane translocase subunit Tim21 isoform X2 n=1 Tax=Condylostylus longicornis TaxID=2530218 RepID=UPI00244DCB79|nr:mitochondrial import inner membrane translocase subunit Tim21 isoform X2 [Condylostylus longicornis]
MSLVVFNKLLRQNRCITQAVQFRFRNCIYYYFSRLNSHKSNTSLNSNHKPKNEVSDKIKPIKERIKENAKTASYIGVIVLGFGVTGIMFYTISKELFSSKSPNTVYNKALQRVISDNRVQDALGVPIKGYGEETKRQRRNHAAHKVFMRNGIEHMRMQFYVQGSRQKATVHLEVKEISMLFPRWVVE